MHGVPCHIALGGVVPVRIQVALFNLFLHERQPVLLAAKGSAWTIICREVSAREPGVKKGQGARKELRRGSVGGGTVSDTLNATGGSLR